MGSQPRTAGPRASKEGLGRDVRRAIARYLRTGDWDPVFAAWPGDIISRCTAGAATLQAELIRTVLQRAASRPDPASIRGADDSAITRGRLAPMVQGLFPPAERRIVLDMLVRGIVFCTTENIRQVLSNERWPETAWDIANLYLGSLGAPLMSRSAPRILGISAGVTCYVSMEYFAAAQRFDDFVLHEAAHVFHNCKRSTAGLPETSRRTWLLDIAFSKRETFAWACEAFGCIVRLDQRAAVRRELAEEWGRTSLPRDDRVDASEILDILRDALLARNGWKRILARCAPSRSA